MVVARLTTTREWTEFAIHILAIKANLSRSWQAGRIGEVGGRSEGVADMAAKVETLPGIARKEGRAGRHVGGKNRRRYSGASRHYENGKLHGIAQPLANSSPATKQHSV